MFLKTVFSLLTSLALFSTICRSQSLVKDSSLTFSSFGIEVGGSIPGGDLSDRFGLNASVGGSFGLKFRSNYTLEATVGFLFGNTIKEPDLLQNLTTSQNTIIGVDGRFADVRIFERGYHIGLNVGKIFSFNVPNPNSGIAVSIGAGFIQHKIKIEVLDNTVPELEGDYVKGYDRLANGWMLKEFFGYRYFGNRKLINFLVGFEFIQGFTQGRRDWNFDVAVPGNEKRTDLLYGIKVGWVVPLYGKTRSTFYYD